MEDKIKAGIRASLTIKQEMLADERLIQTVAAVVQAGVDCFRSGGKTLWCGNGGSAADAQHLAAELSGRFYLDREPLFAEALHVNTSFLTAVANDYGYREGFARMVRAAGRPGDLLFALSTSGNSPNILRAIEDARSAGMQIVGLTGRGGGQMRDRCDWIIHIPSDDTPRIQEGHMVVGHLLCELIEAAMFDDQEGEEGRS